MNCEALPRQPVGKRFIFFLLMILSLGILSIFVWETNRNLSMVLTQATIEGSSPRPKGKDLVLSYFWMGKKRTGIVGVPHFMPDEKGSKCEILIDPADGEGKIVNKPLFRHQLSVTLLAAFLFLVVILLISYRRILRIYREND